MRMLQFSVDRIGSQLRLPKRVSLARSGAFCYLLFPIVGFGTPSQSARQRWLGRKYHDHLEIVASSLFED
jgi:hypothetical protein